MADQNETAGRVGVTRVAPDIERLFPYDAEVTDAQREVFAVIGTRFRELAALLARAIAPGREQALAMTELQRGYLVASLGLTVAPAPSLALALLSHRAVPGAPLDELDVRALRYAAEVLDNGDEGTAMANRLHAIAKRLGPVR